MKIRRFTASTMPEAMQLIKDELGDEAVILANRSITGEDGRPALEITAAVDEAEVAPTPVPQVEGISKNVLKADFTGLGLSDVLTQHGVMPEIQHKILSAVDALGETGFDDFDTLDMVLGKMVSFTLPSRALPKGRAHIFIGPTGSGKTTTLCKLAVDRRISRHSVGFITMDNQKVGAYEQLSIYADAMKERAYMVKNAEEFKAACEDMGERDFLFIDTPGVNPFNHKQIARLKEKIDSLNVDAVIHLIMPAHLHPQEMAAIAPALANLHPENVIFTKFDETSYYGGIVNAVVMSGLKMGYIADGPKVPDDLCEIDSTTLAQKLTEAPHLPWEKK